jgi:hypothetical protein
MMIKKASSILRKWTELQRLWWKTRLKVKLQGLFLVDSSISSIGTNIVLSVIPFNLRRGRGLICISLSKSYLYWLKEDCKKPLQKTTAQDFITNLTITYHFDNSLSNLMQMTEKGKKNLSNQEQCKPLTVITLWQINKG